MINFSYHTDQELLTELRKGEKRAFNEIFARYWDKLYIFAFNMLEDRQISENVVQDVLTSIYIKREELLVANLKSYLFQAIKFQILKYFRNEKIAQKHLDRLTSIAFSNQTEEQMNHKELEANLSEYISQLPEKCREVFIMSRYDYLTNEQIAAKLNISPNTVKNQIAKALRILKYKLDIVVSILIAFLIA